MQHILRNSIRTPDGTEIISEYTHDFVEHIDVNGKTYCVDGGREYLRRVGEMDYEDTSLYFEDSIGLTREVFKWGTYGKQGRDPLKYVKLMDLTTEHINAIIRTQTHLPVHVTDLFKMELVYRIGVEGINSPKLPG